MTVMTMGYGSLRRAGSMHGKYLMTVEQTEKWSNLLSLRVQEIGE